MDLMGFIAFLRWPLEIVSFGLALVPLLSVLLAWPFLPVEIPTHFGPSGRPDRWVSRAGAWILPVLALVVYGLMNQVSGTWAWAFFGSVELPAGAEIPLLLKAGIGLLMACSNAMLIRVFRSQEEAPNGWYLCGLTLLMLASPLALSVVAH